MQVRCSLRAAPFFLFAFAKAMANKASPNPPQAEKESLMSFGLKSQALTLFSPASGLSVQHTFQILRSKPVNDLWLGVGVYGHLKRN
jgi:hypothetical protein